MRPSLPITSVPSAFNPFLYAAVCDDGNGMELTVLSAMARQNVDPWEAAAALSRLPGETALKRLVSMLEAMPGQASLADRTAIAGRLIPLLPNPVHMSGRRVETTHPQEQRLPQLRELSLIMIYLALMFAGQWVYFRGMTPPHERSPVAAGTTPAAAQNQSPADRTAP